MPRRNQGPKLRWFEDRGVYYITWTVNGRSRKCSTGTASREDAEIFLAEWISQRGGRSHGPSDPAQTLVTDVLADYAREHGPKVVAPRAIGTAIEPLRISGLADQWPMSRSILANDMEQCDSAPSAPFAASLPC